MEPSRDPGGAGSIYGDRAGTPELTNRVWLEGALAVADGRRTERQGGRKRARKRWATAMQISERDRQLTGQTTTAVHHRSPAAANECCPGCCTAATAAAAWSVTRNVSTERTAKSGPIAATAADRTPGTGREAASRTASSRTTYCARSRTWSAN